MKKILLCSALVGVLAACDHAPPPPLPPHHCNPTLQDCPPPPPLPCSKSWFNDCPPPPPNVDGRYAPRPPLTTPDTTPNPAPSKDR